MTAAIICFAADAAYSDAVVATRTIQPGTVLEPSDISISRDKSGFYSNLGDVVGLEAKVTLFSGKPIVADQVGMRSVVERNGLVELEFADGVLLILAEGRAMAHGAPGEIIKVMNLSSRQIIRGQVQSDGRVRVGQGRH